MDLLPPTKLTEQQLLETLQSSFGYSSFRNEQKSIIISILKGKSTMALLPTGGGKSLCFQFPTVHASLKTIVISPLIALMQDQVLNTQKKKIPSWYLGSNKARESNQKDLKSFVNSSYGIIYVAPERIQSSTFWHQINSANIDLIVVDEAHCISQWGPDFRPAYRKISTFNQIANKATWLLLTATATPLVAKDIIENLSLQDVFIYKNSFARNNIEISVQFTSNPLTQLLPILNQTKDSIIIYCRNRRTTEEVAFYLNKNHKMALHYHAGLPVDIKNHHSEAWLSNKCNIIVTTNAFGMGIDKPNVRLVIHLDPPPNIEEYYQEIGRAGRDGFPCKAIMILPKNIEKTAILKHKKHLVSLSEMQTIIAFLNDFARKKSPYLIHPVFNIKNHLHIHPLKIVKSLQILEDSNFLRGNDSLYNPSRIRFSKGNIHKLDQEYNIQKVAWLAHFCLRRYENLFTSWVVIDEYEIAQINNCSIEKVKEGLNQLDAYNLLEYQAIQNIPKLKIISELTLAESVLLKLEYQLQKIEQLRKIIAYTQTRECRLKYILRYFEEEFGNCAKCDNCRDHTLIYSEKDFDEFLFKKLIIGPTKIEDVLKNPGFKREKTIKRLQYLATERYIRIRGNLIEKF